MSSSKTAIRLSPSDPDRFACISCLRLHNCFLSNFRASSSSQIRGFACSWPDAGDLLVGLGCGCLGFCPCLLLSLAWWLQVCKEGKDCHRRVCFFRTQLRAASASPTLGAAVVKPVAASTLGPTPLSGKALCQPPLLLFNLRASWRASLQPQ